MSRGERYPSAEAARLGELRCSTTRSSTFAPESSKASAARRSAKNVKRSPGAPATSALQSSRAKRP